MTMMDVNPWLHATPYPKQGNVRFIVYMCVYAAEVYEVGASNLGHVILYTVLNEREGLLCDRSYLPAPDMADMLHRHDKLLFGVESRRPLRDFDILGFSLAYELGGTNILEMLRLCGIPVSWEERREAVGKPWDVESGSLPLIFAGWQPSTLCPVLQGCCSQLSENVLAFE